MPCYLSGDMRGTLALDTGGDTRRPRPKSRILVTTDKHPQYTIPALDGKPSADALPGASAGLLLAGHSCSHAVLATWQEERPMTRCTAARWRLPRFTGAREKGELGGEG